VGVGGGEGVREGRKGEVRHSISKLTMALCKQISKLGRRINRAEAGTSLPSTSIQALPCPET